MAPRWLQGGAGLQKDPTVIRCLNFQSHPPGSREGRGLETDGSSYVYLNMTPDICVRQCGGLEALNDSAPFQKKKNKGSLDKYEPKESNKFMNQHLAIK